LAHLGLNQTKEAEAALANALQADSKYPWALVVRARLVAASGKFDEALALVDQAIVPGDPNGEAHLVRGLLLRFGKKDVDGAIKSFQAAALDPLQSMEARAALIQAYLSRQQLPEAKAELALLQKAYPKKPQTHLLDAIVSYAGKDYAQAEAIADQLLGVIPTNPQLLVLGGGASLQRGNLLAAETKLGKVVQTVERMTAARKMLAQRPIFRWVALRSHWRLCSPCSLKSEQMEMSWRWLDRLICSRAVREKPRPCSAAAVKLKPKDVQVRTALALTDLVKGQCRCRFRCLGGDCRQGRR
jgi:tetratricopeptide (TPR) repeat protein